MDPTNPTTPEIPVPEPEKKDGHWITIAAMALFVAASLIAVGFLYYQNQKLKTMLASYQTQVTPTPVATADPTSNWKTYTISTKPTLNLANYQIKLPPTWMQVEHSSSLQNTETFQDTNTNFSYQLIIHQEKNINPQTSKPYTTLKELTGFPYDVKSLIVDSTSAAQVLPRAGSESDFAVLLFSKDSKLTFNIALNTPRDGSKIQEGGLLFTQILSTFKFLGPTPSPSATQKACTQEAKLCPDGSSVGRTGPNCEFTPCPASY